MTALLIIVQHNLHLVDGCYYLGEVEVG